MPTPSALFPCALVAAPALALGLALLHPLCACADCIDAAAARHQVDATVLRAIGWQESRLRPEALGRNANGSTDLGAFQINSVHLAELGRYGIDRKALGDGCLSAEVAAWHYRRQVDTYGDNWQAVGAYHSQTTARAAWYANQIATVLMRWNAMPAGALPFPGERTLAPGRAPPRPRSAPGFTPSPRVNAAPSSEGDTRIRFGEIAYVPSAR